MSKLSDKEKVLQYLLSQDIKPNGKLLLGTNSYAEVDGLSPDNFIEQIFALGRDQMISMYFHGKKDSSSAVTLEIYPNTKTYFVDKEFAKKEKLWRPIKTNSRDIIFMVANAVISGIVAYIVATLTK